MYWSIRPPRPYNALSQGRLTAAGNLELAAGFGDCFQGG